MTENDGILWDVGPEETEVISRLEAAGNHVYHILNQGETPWYLYCPSDESVPIVSDPASPLCQVAAYSPSHGYSVVPILTGQEWLKQL